MVSLGDPLTSNAVLSALQINSQDKIISIKENINADSNFVITHLIKQVMYEKNRLCLVNFHNTIEHYQCIGKKLGYDLLKAVNEGIVKIIDPLKDIAESTDLDSEYLQENKETLVKQLYFDIKRNLDSVKIDNKLVYLIIDDFSHLHDLDVGIKETLRFLHYCINLIKSDNVCVIFNNHVSTIIDDIISNNLEYLADVHIEVSTLKTGYSQEITGFLTIRRKSSINQYHYKAFDRGVKTFHPGESIYHLYK
ncbi:elongator complex protein 6-like isoform X2 [Diorhabda sublineata]|nr:elongator complex protein 6-like isoform X2 [Diorhabda sublineata]XP_056629990.1 elongator complex protein 6-like isoform X2 [Diorhabda sublineata]